MVTCSSEAACQAQMSEQRGAFLLQQLHACAPEKLDADGGLQPGAACLGLLARCSPAGTLSNEGRFQPPHAHIYKCCCLLARCGIAVT